MATPIARWFRQCPDPQAAARVLFLQQVGTCAKCDYSGPHHTMRIDRAAMTNELVCRECYERETTEESEPWPPRLDLSVRYPKMQGLLFDRVNSETVGSVKCYNPDTDCGLVSLFDFPREAEYGPLDRDHEIVDGIVMTGPDGMYAYEKDLAELQAHISNAISGVVDW